TRWPALRAHSTRPATAVGGPRLNCRVGRFHRPPLLLAGLVRAAAQRSHWRECLSTCPWHRRLDISLGPSRRGCCVRPRDAAPAPPRRSAAAPLAASDSGRFRTVVDVGGGNGALLAAVLAANPDVEGVLFDQPHVVSGAASLLGRAGGANPCAPGGGE